MEIHLIGILLGICFDTTVTALAKDYLNRSPQQQQYRGVWHHLSERPEGRCAQMVPDPLVCLGSPLARSYSGKKPC